MYNKLRKYLLMCCLACYLFINNVMAQNFEQDELINITVYEKLNPSIVAIDGKISDEEFSSGTGCIISSDGLILTSRHVIDGVKDIKVKLFDGTEANASIIGTVKGGNDLALLKINTKKSLKPVILGNSTEIKVGQKVLAIGNPFGFNNTLTTGIVSRVDFERNKIQTDAAINPGSSGGPLVNSNAEVIGINQSIYNPDNNKSNIGIGFAVPINEAKDFIKKTNYLN
ncbi:MAG: trypsin-like peptidase domain-containing protein [Candidatus Gastranaerophilales bacterium]|nr:trypsin-like peptidase domain-containing protein [Candidatus Gastranaerophilales bacterium]